MCFKTSTWAKLYTWRMANGLERCRLCGSYDKLTFEHLLPKAKGGTGGIHNISITCYPCNSSRPLEYLNGVQPVSSDVPGTVQVPAALMSVGDLTVYGVVTSIAPHPSRFKPNRMMFTFDEKTAIIPKYRPRDGEFAKSNNICLLTGIEYQSLRYRSAR